MKNKNKIAAVYSHHKLGDLLWQLPYIKAISDNYNLPVTLVARSKTQAKEILKDLDYINDFFYCEFRKKIWYFFEIFYLYKFFKKEKFTHIFLLDKISRPAIAAKLAGIKNIIGHGIKNQKKWLTNKKFLNDKDYFDLDYSEQSKKFLEINGINVSNTVPYLKVKKETLNSIEPNVDISKKTVSFGVDSFENYKMWFEEYFAELADLLTENNYADQIFLIASKNNEDLVKRIINLSKKSNLFSCSNFNLLSIVKVISSSNFYVGNNSGPLNLASALNIKCFGLIANDRVSELKNSNIIPILPDDYVNTYFRDREGMRRLTVKKVFDFIESKLN